MVQNVNKLKGKIIENGYSIRTLASEVNLCEVTLRRKINNDAEFSIQESLEIKDKLKLSTQEYVDIFFGEKLEFNS